MRTSMRTATRTAIRTAIQGVAIGLLAVFAVTIGMARQAQAQETTGQAANGGAQATKLYTSSAEVAALVARAKSIRKEGEHNVVQPILQLAPYTANVEYRASVGPATVHVHEAEVFYVIDGSAIMVTGGKLVGQTGTNQENLSGTAIEGGTSRPVAKGDFILVPENTPHWFSSIDGTLVLMSLHVPRPVPGR